MKIMFDPTMTEEERRDKMEQMADNEVRKVQELHRLEQEEKNLFGFYMEGLLADQEGQNAEKTWISAESLQRMTECFLDDLLGKGEYIRGKNALKTLRLSSEKRQRLLTDFKRSHVLNRNHASSIWEGYLRSGSANLNVTFDSECAKDHREAAFFTQMHPLVQQAAHFEGRNFPCEVGVTAEHEELGSGDYDFLIYAWNYVGLRPDIKLVAISDNRLVQTSILSLLQYGSGYEYETEEHRDHWEKMDALHYAAWQMVKEEYVSQVREECEYRIDQLAQSVRQREAIYMDMIERQTDDKIIRMRTSQLLKLRNDHEEQKKRMREAASKADIHTDLLVRGVLHVR